MALLRAQHILPFFTNLPTDVIVNQFHFLWDESGTFAAQATEISSRLADFYMNAYSSTGSARANYIDWPQATVKVFNLSDPTPRVPEVRTQGYSAGSNATSIPTEVACVLSFHAAPESGTRFQRLYNRIYLGGLTNAWMSASAVDAFPRLATAQVEIVSAAAITLTSEDTSVLQWQQVSEATGLIQSRQISGGWTDNGPDTQRRRSVLSSVRDVWNSA